VTTPLTHAERLSASDLSRSLMLVTAGVAAVAMTATAGALGASAQTSEPTAEAVLRAAFVAAPLGAAFYAWRMVPYQRFAHLLAVTGVVGFVTTLAEARDPTLYSIGRAAGWTLELLLVALLLAFPDGPLRARGDRRLVLAMGAVVAIFYFPTILLTDRFQVPSPYTSCVRDCPVNAFSLHDGGLSFAPLFLGTGSVLVLVVMAGVLVRLRRRVLDASAVQREALSPVLAVGMARAGLVGILIVVRQAGADTDLVQAGATVIAWATPAISVAFVVGLFRSRLAAERTLRSLAASVRGAPPALQRSVAEAFADPTLELTFPLHDQPQRWVDCHSEPVPVPAGSEGRCFRLIRDGHQRIVGALTGDRILDDRPELLDVATGLIAMAVEQRRLEQEAGAATREAQDSRARLAESADAERRRIERDLHDGAQQRIVAMRIELGLIEDLLHDDPDSAAARIRELEASADEALEELRSLAHGVHPALLSDRGLPDALRAALARSALPASFHAAGIGRYPPAIESAVYFSVLEALQNVAKHARGARRVTVHLNDDTCGELRFEVRDDGPGTSQEALEHGEGMTNMRDRVAAVNGSLRVTSAEGSGTTVAGRIPIAPAQRTHITQQP
jgi:signal transduction histidine kinase